MIQEITPVNFPNYLKLREATVTLNEMGDRLITTQVYIDGDITPSFEGTDGNPLMVKFRGEEFIMPLKKPQMSKGNERQESVVDLTFYSWPVYQMKRYFYVDFATTSAGGTSYADKYKASKNLDIQNFATDFNNVLSYYFGGRITASFRVGGTNTEIKYVGIDNSYIWDVLQSVYETYDRRWDLTWEVVNGVTNYHITFDCLSVDISHDFEYGYNGGLLKLERQVQDDNIRNIILGRGGNKNLPRYYFKTNPNTEAGTAAAAYKSDPDAIPELSSAYFDGLRDYNFRLYVQGWAAGKGYEGHSYDQTTYNAEWAYKKGYDDATTVGSKFEPVEYVKDNASITKYGELWAIEDANEDIYPSIQGADGGVDEIVAAEQVTTDSVKDAEQKELGRDYVRFDSQTIEINADDHEVLTFNSGFVVPEPEEGALVGNLSQPVVTYIPPETLPRQTQRFSAAQFNAEITNIVIRNASTGVETSTLTGLNPGSYTIAVTIKAENFNTSTGFVFTIGVKSMDLVFVQSDSSYWNGVFHIWLPNVWGTSQESGESDDSYVERVWMPILGTVDEEAAVVFASGQLAASSDWDFKIVGPILTGVHHDTSKTRVVSGRTITSEWRLTLAKSDAELDADNKYIPREGINAAAGDKYFFTGIDMPQRYVKWAEQKLRNYKNGILNDVKDINPQWAMTLDKIRIQNLNEGEASTLISQFGVGKKVTLKDKRMIGPLSTDKVEIYIQTLNYKWSENSLIPDVEVTLAEKALAVLSSVSRLETEVSHIASELRSVANVQEVVENICTKKYLQKAGATQESVSPTSFSDTVSQSGFIQDAFAGAGWGLYTNDDNESVLEIDKLIARKSLEVNEIVANQISYVGGKQIISATSIQCTRVEYIAASHIYRCFFDIKGGTVKNMFVVNDIAMSETFDEENSRLSYYKYLVSSVGLDYIDLDTTHAYPSSNTPAPIAGDVIVQYGNTNTASRQFAIVRDIIGGGYEKMVSGLNAVNTDGVIYYFAGYQSTTGNRWFIGNAQTYAEFINGALTVKGNIYATDGTAMDGWKYLAESLSNNGASGIVLAKQLAVTDGTNIQGGISGEYTSETSIAAWFGGPKADKESQPAPQSFAASLFRFNGTGYLAKGNISWDSDGKVRLAGDTIIVGGNESLSSLIQSIANVNNKIDAMFVTETVSGVTYIRAKSNLYSVGSISAGGIGTGGSGGGGDVSSMTVDGQTGYSPLSQGVINLTLNQYLTDKLWASQAFVTGITGSLSSLSTTAKNTLVAAINEVYLSAQGASHASVYSNYSTLVAALNAASGTAFAKGQSIYIETINVPDVWIKAVSQSATTYTYTTDDAFITDILTNGGNVGYFQLAPLETQKVDLTDYAKKNGSNASGTWGISISGNAATATKATQDGNGANIVNTYQKKITSSNKLPASNVSGLATVATSGNYNDLSNKPTIPDVSCKADKVASATNGNFAGLDANGNLTDSGKKPSDFLTEHQSLVEYSTTAEMNAAIAAHHDTTKVDKVSGKGLSTNDYDDTEKGKVAANTTARHTHSNKSLLDSYTQTNANLADAVTKKHAHGNLALLETYTQTEANLSDAVAKKHSHANITELNKIANGDKAKWDAKQDTISDLNAIRSGATLGATAVQPSALNDYYTKTQVDGKDITAIAVSASKVTLTRTNGNLESDIPTWNQDTTGNAATATLASNLGTSAHKIYWDATANAFKVEGNIFATGSVSAGGIGTGGSGGGGSVSSMTVDGIQGYSPLSEGVINLRLQQYLTDNGYALQSSVTAISDRLPSGVIANQAFVNSSIATATADFKGTYDTTTFVKVTRVNRGSTRIIPSSCGLSDSFGITSVQYSGSSVILKNGNTALATIAIADIEGSANVFTYTFGGYTITGKVIATMGEEANYEALIEIAGGDYVVVCGETAYLLPDCIDFTAIGYTEPNNNDYCFFNVRENNAPRYDRYKMTGDNGWEFEYSLNNSSFTSAQWDAINSGADSTKIAEITGKLDKSGGTMTGDVNMGGHKVNNASEVNTTELNISSAEIVRNNNALEVRDNVRVTGMNIETIFNIGTDYSMSNTEGYANYIITAGDVYIINLPTNPVTGRSFILFDTYAQTEIYANNDMRIFGGANGIDVINTGDTFGLADYCGGHGNAWKFIFDGTYWNVLPFGDLL